MTRALPWIAALLFLTGTAGAATTIELIDAGAAPRAPLRYQFQAGTAERVTIEMQTTMLREGSGPMPPMAASPALRTVMETRVTEVAADGSARIEMVTRSTEAAAGPASTAQPAAQMNDALADISRLGGWFRVDTRGRTIEGHAALSPASGPGTESQPMMEMALDEVNNSMQNEVAMFPEEAVGEGARWRVSSAQVFMGVNTQMVQEYTLRKRNGHLVELEMKSAGPTLDTGSAALAGAPPMQQRVESKGTATVNLRGLNPAMTMQVDSEISAAAPGQAAAPVMKTQMRMTITPEAL